MKLAIYLVSAILGFFGLMFVVGAQGSVARIVVGVVLFAGAGLLVYLTRVQPQSTTVVQKIDLSGDVSLEGMTCRNCGSQLTEKSIKVQGGAIYVNCEFCGTAYQVEEAPKW